MLGATCDSNEFTNGQQSAGNGKEVESTYRWEVRKGRQVGETWYRSKKSISNPLLENRSLRNSLLDLSNFDNPFR